MPNPRQVVPPEHADRIRAARAKRDEGQEELQAAVLAALEVSSVREVAAVAGVDPSTVQRWHDASH